MNHHKENEIRRICSGRLFDKSRYAVGMLFMIFLILPCSSCNDEGTPVPGDINFRQEMRHFVQNISDYAKQIKPDFVIVPQNGVELVGKTEGDLVIPVAKYIDAIDGIGQEDLLYGYDNDDEATPEMVTSALKSYLDIAKDGNVTIMVTDYCYTHSKMDDSYVRNSAWGYISFAADHRGLDNIPDYPDPIFRENQNIVSTLSEAENFLYLIDPSGKYNSKQDFINAVKNTNYDLLITDLFFNENAFTKDEVLQLKIKANGGIRMVISYMSIGEAEDYRYYWQPDWKPGNPPFIEKENPDWKGNYVVRYWDPDWQKIIFGNEGSYLKKIIDAGFDGVYLDIIDAYEYFEQ
jgi:cysteinyl-tRNA synthetase